MRLIDERELVRRISELPDLRTINTATIGKIIKECSTVDAEPVRHGRWIYSGGCIYACSVCHNYTLERSGKNYCPNCGAKMDAEV